MASLYTHKAANIRKTWLIFALFLIVVIAIGWVFAQIYGEPTVLIVAVIFSIFMNVLAYWHSDKIVLRMSRAQPVTRENARDLYNVVENLCIAAGLPLPKIYIIDERAPNAFATGRNPEHAVVAVTTGLLQRLNRSELEGVIAHELSHIGNRDMLVSTVVVVLVGFISIISDIFLRTRFRGRGRGNVGGILLLIGLILAILSPIISRLMHFAISRKRELLADASGALLTRYPEGLANALIKISKDPTPLPVATNTTAHLWFDDPFDKPGEKISWLHKLFMTHPPVEERIKALTGMKI